MVQVHTSPHCDRLHQVYSLSVPPRLLVEIVFLLSVVVMTPCDCRMMEKMHDLRVWIPVHLKKK